LAIFEKQMCSVCVFFGAPGGNRPGHILVYFEVLFKYLYEVSLITISRPRLEPPEYILS
jgi:hypothetical protein